MSEQGGTVRYHRAEYLGDVSYPWEVWFDGGQGPIFFTAEQGEAMGLTPPEPAPLVVTCNGHSIELSDEQARLFAESWAKYDARYEWDKSDGPRVSASLVLARLLRDARQDPQPTADTPSDDIDFDALPIGTVLRFDKRLLRVKTANGWHDDVGLVTPLFHQRDKYEVVYQPPPLSPRQCLEALLAGRDDADELIEYAEQWGGRGLTPDGRWRSVIGAAARGGASDV